MGVLGRMVTSVSATTSCSVSDLMNVLYEYIANIELMKLIPTHVFLPTVFWMPRLRWSVHPKLESCNIHQALCRS